MPETTWPAEVIARYLTVGTATVNVTIAGRPHKHDDGITGIRQSTVASCTGCLNAEEFPHWRTHRGEYAEWEVNKPELADTEARAWAQDHAETCRAMPRPTGA